MDQLQVFDFNGHSVRVVPGDDGEPRWVASDVAKVLQYRDANNMFRGIDEEDRGYSKVSTPGGRQRMTVVNESGLYTAIVRANTDRARAFRRWVTSEVLPSIRKRGGYLTPEATQQALQDPDFIIQLATSLKQERARVAALEASREADRPKVVFADAVSASDSEILVGELAKILRGNGINIGANRLFEWLRTNGFLIARNSSDRNMPTQKSMELGLFRIKETAITHADGHVSISKTPKVTGKGQQYFVQRFLSGQFSAA